MRVLLTGASSFTGYWFARELAAAGHEVTATLRVAPEAYDGVRRARVDHLRETVTLEPGVSFGDERFMEVIEKQSCWDVLCHHAAEVADYKSEDFDVAAALASNTRNAQGVLAELHERGCRRLVLTGSVFEQDEGAGSEGLPAFSPYGLSKGLTSQVFRYHARRARFHFAKFVIANPFGPYEDSRFTSYLMRTWSTRGVARVQTPAYVRDNIHVSLLAKAYARFVGQLPGDSRTSRLAPTGYPESQGAFTLRFASELRGRLGLPCAVELANQASFLEPHVRINTDRPDPVELNWSESRAWDELAEYYGAYLSP